MSGPGEIRCFCSRKPLLARFGRDDNGDPWIHVKAHRQDRIYAEVVVTEGTAHLKCRECLRWTRLVIRRMKVNVDRDAELPETVNLAS